MAHLHRRIMPGRGSGGPPHPPPPPTLNASHSSSRDRHGRSRSRSLTRQTRPRYEEGSSGRYVDNRNRGRSDRRSSSPYRSALKEERNSSNFDAAYASDSRDSRNRERQSAQHPHISRIPPQDPNTSSIIRTILNPENVTIPRRVNEGLRPIFDRDELRESIKRRIEGGDLEHNPQIAAEQRVVAIIREPMQMAPQFMQPEMIPMIPQFIPEQMMMQQQQQDTFETSSGVTVSFPYAKQRSRSHSTELSRRDFRDRGRERRQGSPLDNRVRRMAPDLKAARARRGSRSRSRSTGRVERVRLVTSYTLNPGSGVLKKRPRAALRGRPHLQQDLRESLNERLQLTKALAAERVRRNSGDGGTICWHCNKPGHQRDECRLRKMDIAIAKKKVWTTTPCIHCNKHGHYSADCWNKKNPNSAKASTSTHAMDKS